MSYFFNDFVFQIWFNIKVMLLTFSVDPVKTVLKDKKYE